MDEEMKQKLAKTYERIAEQQAKDQEAMQKQIEKDNEPEPLVYEE